MGASGDLAPLSHLALGLMGEGKMWSPKSGWADAKYVRPPNRINVAFSAVGNNLQEMCRPLVRRGYRKVTRFNGTCLLSMIP